MSARNIYDKKLKLKNRAGVTLISLVITIIIIIILATVTINASLGENGLIKQAKNAKDATTNSITQEEEDMNKTLLEYENAMLEQTPIVPPTDIYMDSVVAEPPKLTEGMVPVKWDEDSKKWIKTTKDDSQWYNYAEKKWANIVLTPTSGEKEGKDATGTTDVFNPDGTLNENSKYSMLVWIPRYAYQITSQYHQNGSAAGNINIVFVDTNNQNKTKTKTYSEKYPSYSTENGMSGVAEEGCEAGYVVHPAFNYGDSEETKTKLAGIWVGKYETSHTGSTTDASTGTSNTNVTTLVATIRPGVTSWRNINISNIYTVCTELNKEGNVYGLNSDDSVVDPHLMKNSEWGAVAYLSQNSIYGKGSEIWINNNTNYITGRAGDGVSETSSSDTGEYSYNTSNGVQASTTGNTSGVYDMSGGTYECTAAYINNGHENLRLYGSSLVDAETRYKDVYQSTSSSGNDSQSGNYNLSIPTNEKYGDAIYETSNSFSDMKSWYLDYSKFPYSNSPFFVRGGFYDSNTSAGIFSFSNPTEEEILTSSFRIVIPIL